MSTHTRTLYDLTGSDTIDEDDFNEVWNDIYDLADSDRVWLNAFAPRGRDGSGSGSG